EIAVRPAIAPLTDAFGEAVIDGGVAERAGDADRGDLAALEECVQPDDRVRLEQRYRAGGIVEVDCAILDAARHLLRHAIGIHLEPEREGRPGRKARPGTTELLSQHGLVQAEPTTPAAFTAHGHVAIDR